MSRRPSRDDLVRHKKPCQRNEDSQSSTDTHRASRSQGLENRTADESSQEQRNSGDKPVVPRYYELAEFEELGVGHELDPDSGQDNCEISMSIQDVISKNGR